MISYLNHTSFKIINKMFLSNFYIWITLLVFPLIIGTISFINSNNAFVYNQNVVSILSVDIMLIFIVFAPITKRILENSLFIKISNDYKQSRRILIRNMYIYYFFISILFILYSILIVFLFGLKQNEYIILSSTNEKIINFNDLVFSDKTFFSKQLGIYNYDSNNWLLLIIGLLFSILYYISVGYLISCVCKNNQWLYITVIVISFISLVNGSLLISSDVINQYLIYKIFSYFSFSQYQVVLTNILYLNKINNLNNFYFIFYKDNDFLIQISDLSLSIYIFVFIVFIILSSFITYLILGSKNKTKQIIKQCNNNFYDKYNKEFNASFIDVDKQASLATISFNKYDFSALVMSEKNKRSLIKSLTKNYDLYNNLNTNNLPDRFGLFIENNINHIYQYNAKYIFDLLFKLYDNEFVYKVWDDFKAMIDCIKKPKWNKHYFDEYLIYLSFIINSSDDEYLIIEWLDIYRSKNLLYKIKEISQDKKTIIFISNNLGIKAFDFDRVISFDKLKK